MNLPVTSITAGALALLFVFLSLRVSGVRRRRKIALGDGGDKEIIRAIRVHANLAEYLPTALVLLALQELQNFPRWWLWTFCVAFVLARGVHSWGMSQTRETFAYRIAGTATTYTLIGVSAVALLVHALKPFF